MEDLEEGHPKLYTGCTQGAGLMIQAALTMVVDLLVLSLLNRDSLTVEEITGIEMSRGKRSNTIGR